ncbi:hypothetical protein HGG82_15155 [Marinomonas sp. M1K-6]|uniref:Anti sigma-E protein RseA N-terminal domain-containing protein n=1 Tax=Marinomonas profundi TaxID=2726122 RepID=A0A847RD23_9GAMM|nr:hypothetical protein [Marinomonas profundi]NLQ18944.1 hypothetical protein [Marinomonas profundi]UDV02317.1 hypothetical protein J8N69_12020 [Marinomonas profundi]
MAAKNDNLYDLRASLSAMFDGEATEHDINGLLTADSAELAQQSLSLHLIQQTLHKDSEVSIGLQDNLLQRIQAQLSADELGMPVSGEKAHSVIRQERFESRDKVVSLSLPVLLDKMSDETPRSSWKTVFSSLAVAASVTFVVILGGNELFSLDGNVSAEQVTAAVPNGMVTPLEVAPLASLNSDALQIDNTRLQNYLRQHAEQATMTVGQGMIPMARVVSYPMKE